jgi:hypothetical protein
MRDCSRIPLFFLDDRKNGNKIAILVPALLLQDKTY